MTAVNVLIEARKLIEKPENWASGFDKISKDRCCVAVAIATVARRVGTYDADTVLETFGRANELPGPLYNGVFEFNDTHSHAEVLAAFDRAIEAARASQIDGQSR